jgi:TRAP-type mannitol/chloroaromatic compound transport system permease small subunit
MGNAAMELLLGLSRAIDKATAMIGRAVYWLILAAILVSAANAMSRKLLSISSNGWLELQWYLFGAAYLLAAAYTLQRNEHIRIDIVSNLFPKAVRNWIDLFGHLVMLIPFGLIMLREEGPTLANSYEIGETSSNYGGLIVWPAKALIMAGFALLVIQAGSEVIKRVAFMQGLIADPYASKSSNAPAE